MRSIRKIEATAQALPSRKRVAAYARVSEETGRLHHSISAQISRYSELIQSRPDWTYIGVYADEGLSGTKAESRPEFQRLLADCESGRIDIILTKSISRFARNTVDLLNTVRRLKELDIEVRFEKENINSLDEKGEVMLTLLASFAQEESRSTSENIKWAIRKGFERGKMICRLLYGYRYQKGTLVIEAEEAETVRQIFSRYLAGASCYQIAKELNAQNRVSYRGKAFSHAVICQMIKNEKYTGDALLQKYFVESHITHKLKRNRGELDMHFAQNTHPAIIDRDTFAKVQVEIAKRKGEIDGRKRKAHWSEKKRDEHRQQYIHRETAPILHEDLSLFIRCGECGKNYTTYTSKLSNGTYRRFWRCTSHDGGPRPLVIKDHDVKALICDVLKLQAFDLDVMNRELSHAVLLGNTITFHFRDGRSAERFITKKRSPNSLPQKEGR